MNLFPEEFSDIGRTSGLGENVQSPRPSDWGGNLIADVYAWFQTTPGANPNPSVEAIYYYANSTYDQFLKDVAAVRAANPTVAAQIDAERREAGLDAPVTPPPPVVVQPPPPVVVQPPQRPIIDCKQGYMPDASGQCVPIPGYVFPPTPRPPVTQPPRPVFQGPIYSASSGTANATMIGYLSDDPSKAEFTVTAGSQVPDNFVLVRALPAVVKPPVVVQKPETALEPIYTKEYPYPTAESDIYGYLYGQDELDKPIRRPFNLKKGDPIPVNWQAEQPMTSPGEPAQPGAAGGAGTLLLAAVAAYLLGS